jgi:hypothetical protein
MHKRFLFPADGDALPPERLLAVVVVEPVKARSRHRVESSLFLSINLKKFYPFY